MFRNIVSGLVNGLFRGSDMIEQRSHSFALQFVLFMLPFVKFIDRHQNSANEYISNERKDKCGTQQNHFIHSLHLFLGKVVMEAKVYFQGNDDKHEIFLSRSYLLKEI